MQERQTDNRGNVAAVLVPTALFALHTFLLMGTGTWSDLAMAGKDFATVLYYVREGALGVGFLVYAAFSQLRRSRPLSQTAADVAFIVLFALFAVCIGVLHGSDQPAFQVPAVLVVALLVGVSGGLAYERIVLAAFRQAAEPGFPSVRDGVFRLLGFVVGVGGALAVALQFVLQIGFSLGEWLNACFVVCFGALMWLARKLRFAASDVQTVEDAGKDGLSTGSGAKCLGATSFICMVVVSMCLFALLPIYTVVMRESGDVAAFYEWYRLFTASGYIVIGAAAYLGGRRAASVAVMVSALFAIIVSAQTALLEAGPLTMVLFYFLLSAALAWSGIAFMSAAAQSAHPAFVASAWRVISALVTMAEVLIPAAGGLSLMAVLTSSLALLAAMVVAMVKGGFLEADRDGAEGLVPQQEGASLSTEERMLLLAGECGLTDREREVLTALVTTELKNQQIADDLGISRRQLQNHISSIYEKTGTQTRAGLIMRVNNGE